MSPRSATRWQNAKVASWLIFAGRDPAAKTLSRGSLWLLAAFLAAAQSRSGKRALVRPLETGLLQNCYCGAGEVGRAGL